MTVYVALLRAINVGGTGRLPMKDLAALCSGLGFGNVRTYIQSGNVVFESRKGEEAVLAANPFPKAPPAKVGVAFLNSRLSKSALKEVVIPGKEDVILGRREAYVHFPDGMGRSKLKLPKSWGPATMRNINTVDRLAAMAAELSG